MICQGCNQWKPIEHTELLLCSGCNARRRKAGTADLPDLPPALQSKRQLAAEHKKKKRQQWKQGRRKAS